MVTKVLLLGLNGYACCALQPLLKQELSLGLVPSEEILLIKLDQLHFA